MSDASNYYDNISNKQRKLRNKGSKTTIQYKKNPGRTGAEDELLDC